MLSQFILVAAYGLAAVRPSMPVVACVETVYSTETVTVHDAEPTTAALGAYCMCPNNGPKCAKYLQGQRCMCKDNTITACDVPASCTCPDDAFSCLFMKGKKGKATTCECHGGSTMSCRKVGDDECRCPRGKTCNVWKGNKRCECKNGSLKQCKKLATCACEDGSTNCLVAQGNDRCHCTNGQLGACMADPDPVGCICKNGKDECLVEEKGHTCHCTGGQLGPCMADPDPIPCKCENGQEECTVKKGCNTCKCRNGTVAGCTKEACKCSCSDKASQCFFTEGNKTCACNDGDIGLCHAEHSPVNCVCPDGQLQCDIKKDCNTCQCIDGLLQMCTKASCTHNDYGIKLFQ